MDPSSSIKYVLQSNATNVTVHIHVHECIERTRKRESARHRERVEERI